MADKPKLPGSLPDVIADSLGLTPLQQVTPPSASLTPYEKSGDPYQDSDATLDNVIEAGTYAIQDLLDKAPNAGDPARVYRVMSEMMGTIVTASKAKMEIKALDAKIKGDAAKGQRPDTVNQNLIISTKDLANLLNGRTE